MTATGQSHSFLQRVAAYAVDQQMFQRVTRLVVAVSGGADSVALLDWLVTAGPAGVQLIVAHLNHGLRGGEAAADADFVGELAQKYSLPCVQKTVDVAALAAETGASLEESGREARYQFFFAACAEYGADAVAVAHHADDQAETLLLRLLRGAGTAGLKAMRGRSADGRLLRPFLAVSRVQIEEYLRYRGLAWREDASNADHAFLRNRVRHELLPLLGRYNPAIADQLCITADILAADDAALDLIVQEQFSRIARIDPGQVRLPVTELGALPIAIQRRVIRLAIARVAGSCRSIGFNHLQQIARLMGPGGPSRHLDLPGALTVERRYQELVVRTATEGGALPELQITGPGVFLLGDGRSLVVTTGTGPLPAASTCPGEMVFFPEAVPFPWRLRYFRAGDRFRPAGMLGQQKVKEYFINRKIPRAERCRVPILESDGQIIWLCGERIAADVGNPGRQGRWVAASLQANPPSSLPG